MVTIPGRSQSETRSQRWRRWAGEWARVARVLTSRSDTPKTGQIYDIIGTQNLFGEESLFINLGYWKNNPATLDEASKDLARLVARSAEFGPSDVVVDCGTGYGDQDLLFVTEFGVKHITGVNIADEQINISSRRVADAGLADRIEYVRASATDLPMADGSATKVVAMESAFHFPSRVDFFSEALRVLKPGGLLVTADIVPKRTFVNWRFRRTVQRLGWRGAPAKAARKAADVPNYRELLLQTGFDTAEVRSIADDVYPPLGRFVRKTMFAEGRKRVNPVLRWTVRPDNFWIHGWHVDYILAIARKKG